MGCRRPRFKSRKKGRVARHAPSKRITFQRTAAAIAGAAVALLSSCMSLTQRPRALVYSTDSLIRAQSLSCTDATTAVALDTRNQAALDGDCIRIVTLNLHKQADKGWQRDLYGFARAAMFCCSRKLV